MKHIIIILFILISVTAKSQYKYVTFDRTVIRYSSTITPVNYCVGGNCADVFMNNNGDTLAVIDHGGVADIRVNVTVKDTLNSVSIIEPNGQLSTTRYIFNGSKAIGFNQNNYYLVTNFGSLPYKIYRTSDNELIVTIGQSMQQWHGAMPLPQTITTNIKRYMLP